MGITTIAGALLDNHPRRKNKGSLLDITIIDPSNSSSLENAARHTGNHLTEAVEQKKNKYRGSFSAFHSLIPLVMSSCGKGGSDVYASSRSLRIGRRSEKYFGEFKHMVEGVVIARLRQRSSIVLQ